MFKKIIFSLLVVILSQSLSAQNWGGNGKKIRGNGNVITVNRTTSDYNGISVGGSFDVVLVKGKEGTIQIEGEENVIPYIETEVKRNSLKIKYRNNSNVRTTRKLTVTITFEDIDKVSLGGSGNITCQNTIKSSEFSVSLGGSGNITLDVEADKISSSIGGSGNINLAGKTTDFNCSIAGSGSINGYNLNSDTTNATIAGSGNIKTTVNKNIKAKVVGSGNIFYKGNPKYTDIKSVGSGNVIDKN